VLCKLINRKQLFSPNSNRFQYLLESGSGPGAGGRIALAGLLWESAMRQNMQP